MRVVHVHRIRGIGGSERHLLTLLPALAERGVDVTFLGLDDPGWDAEPFYRELGVEAVRLSCGRDLDPGLAWRVRRELRRLRPDVVHTHLAHADVYGALGAGAAALVSTKHNDDRFRLGPFRYVERTLTRKAARVIAITEALRRFCVDGVGLPAEKVEVVHYGLDTLPEPWGESAEVPLPVGARVLLCVSRLVEQKGVDVAVRALRAIRARHPMRCWSCSARDRSGRAWPARASTCRDVSATWPRGTGERSCSSTRRAGRASALRCWRRCWPASRWSPRGSAGPGDRHRRRDGAAGPARRPGCAGGGGLRVAVGRGAGGGDGRSRPCARRASSRSRRWSSGRLRSIRLFPAPDEDPQRRLLRSVPRGCLDARQPPFASAER